MHSLAINKPTSKFCSANPFINMIIEAYYESLIHICFHDFCYAEENQKKNEAYDGKFKSSPLLQELLKRSKANSQR